MQVRRTNQKLCVSVFVVYRLMPLLFHLRFALTKFAQILCCFYSTDVYKAEYKNTLVAAKTLKEESRATQRLLVEAAFMTSVSTLKSPSVLLYTFYYVLSFYRIFYLLFINIPL